LASKEIHVPDLGDFKDVAVIDVLIKPGDTVQVDTPLLTLETEKATMDVPSTDAGVIEKVHVSKGSKVSAGSLIASIASEGAAPEKPAAEKPAGEKPVAEKPVAENPAPAAKASADQAAPAAPPAAKGAKADKADKAGAAPPAAQAAAAPVKAAANADDGRGIVNEASFAGAHASPSVRRFARELGVDLGRVGGSGQKGRVTEEDVKAFVKSLMAGGASPAGAAGSGLPKINVPDFSQFGPVEVQPLNRVQRISGPRLHASWVNLPHVTQFDEADVTDMEKLREELKSRAEGAGIKLTPLAFIVRACVKALQKFPLFNASLDASGENLVYKKYIHMGFAADTPNGLLVPVIRDADRKDIYEIARALADLSAKARAGKLSAAEMQGGSFTISSLGGIGGTAFTPIINAPEVAILGVSRSTHKPVYRDGDFVPRLMLPLSLSYDHRVVDGANGARFTTYLASALADAHGLAEAVP
jgi:pyruvate dehydrogenase E2 component (dihydrolipoamide acetyltransferase)